MIEFETREKCLRLAIATPGVMPEMVVELAERYFAYVVSRQEPTKKPAANKRALAA